MLVVSRLALSMIFYWIWNFGILNLFLFTLLYIINYNPAVIRVETVTIMFKICLFFPQQNLNPYRCIPAANLQFINVLMVWFLKKLIQWEIAAKLATTTYKYACVISVLSYVTRYHFN